MSFLSGSRNLIILTAILAAQGATGYFLNARQENQPTIQPLATIGQTIGDWTMVKEWKVEPEVQAVLKADDTLSRHYAKPDAPAGAGLFIAFFRSQRAGVAPHSPKNCLPGNGWVAERSTVIPIEVPGRAEPVEANYYVVQRGDNKSVVVYWYQSHGRTVADEFAAKFYVVSDAIRLNRTDTALVRVTVPVGPGGEATAEQAALDFVRKAFGPISAVLPGESL
jgi:EpsI family protein